MLPILYSFRRCPYAMRARLAIAVSKQPVRLREIILKNKPAELLAISPDKTIPVLQILDQNNNTTQVLTESLEIMVWALHQNDPEQWLNGPLNDMLSLIDQNDNEFKSWLDKYKYADRHIEHEPNYYREQAEDFIMQLEQHLQHHQYLFSHNITLADMAIVPFIRQFASVDQEWFEQSPYVAVQKWLNTLINGPLFSDCMVKYPTWLSSGEEILFPSTHI
jgi:glutathione S-transferase